MNSAVFPWKMLAVMAAVIAVLFVGGLCFQGIEKANAQPTANLYKRTIATTITGPDSSLKKGAKKPQLKAAIAKQVKHNTVTKTDARPADDEDATPLDESIVMAMSPSNKPDNSADTREAHPKTGWDAFEKYLSMDAVSPTGKPSTVRLAFVVNNDGTITNFKIKTGVDAATDKKAVKLIKNGPSWVGNINKQANEVNVTVNFH